MVKTFAPAVLINIPRNLTLVGFVLTLSAMNILNCVMNRLTELMNIITK